MNVLITGGSRGIGRAVALKFASESASVAITYHSDEESAAETVALCQERDESGDGRFEAFQLDVTKSDRVDGVFDDVLAEFGSVDVVVNNAGIMDNQPAAMMTDEAWNSVVDTNLTGAFYVARAALSEMMLQRSGSIVNISSIAEGGASGQANYAASKAGLVGLTKSLAREYGERGITANAVVPGLIDTDMIADADDRLVDHWETFCPVGRLGTPEEVAEAVWFLSRPAASFVNGAVLRVSGGLDAAP